jgi:mannose-1-phosphate guanylyltransferase/mannose-1-phosphate guanylyltransferase/phosphomannomutase
MEYSIKLQKKHGITDIIANTHYHPQYIQDYFEQGEPWGVRLQYSYEKELLGTAGGVKNNRNFLDETFFVLSGDALTDIDLDAMYQFHKKNRSLATIALKSVDDVSRYGVVIADETGRIKSFQEKPKAEEALSNVVNTGIYLFEPEIFDLIPDGFYDFGRELFPKLLELGREFFGYVTENYWCDIGTVDVYLRAQTDALNRPSLKEMASDDGCFMLKKNCLAGINSTLDLSVRLGNNVYIGRNCSIGSKARLSNCIIWDNCTVLENAVVENSIIGANCQIGMISVIKGGSLIGNNSIIGKNIVLKKKSSIQTNSIVMSSTTDLG